MYRFFTSAKMRLLVLLLCAQTIASDHIFFSTPGDGMYPAGFYGTRLNTSDNSGIFLNLYEQSYNCAHHGLLSKDELDVQSTSIDPVSKKALIAVFQNDFLTVVTGQLCRSSSKKCDNTSVDVIFYEDDQPFEKIGPFAYYNSTSYFLLNTVKTLDVSVSQSKIELRKLSGCSELYPVDSSTAFDMDTCSSVVATLHQEEFTQTQTVSSLDSLLVIPVGSRQVFLTLLRSITLTESGSYETLQINLVQASIDGQTKTLDSRDVDTAFLTWSLHQLGGMSYKDGLLCWSVIDRILCADWTENGLANTQEVVGRGQGAHVCKSANPGSVLNEVITGVAIEDRVGPALFFGCVTEPQAPAGSLGGAGMYHGTSGRVLPVISNSSAVYFGSVLVTDVCDSNVIGHGSSVHTTTALFIGIILLCFLMIAD